MLRLLTAADLDTQLSVDGSADSAALRGAADRLAQRWTTLSGSERRELLLQGGFRVVVKDRRIEVSAQADQLLGLLLKSGSAVNTEAAPKTRRIAKAVDASLIKTAGETRILEEETTLIATALIPGHRVLLKAIAQGRAWAKGLIAGEFSSAEEIAQKTGLSVAHIARGLKCMNVPPDLVGTLVEGKGPADLTWATIRPLHAFQFAGAFNRWRTSAQD